MGRKKTREEVLQLIKKIQRLADPSGGGTEGEMQAAVSRIQHLLKEYNLSLTEVDATHDKDAKEEVKISEKDGFIFKKSSVSKFEKLLASIVATACECQLYFSYYHETNNSGKHVKRFKIVYVGTEVDAIIAGEMYSYLNKRVWKLSKSEFKLAGEQTSFWYGAIHRLGERLSEEAEKFEEEHKEYAIVLMDKKSIIRKYISSNLNLRPSRTKAGGTKNGSDYAYGRGYAEGGKLDMSKGKHLE